MEELRTNANLIEAFENGNPVAVLSRRDLDEMLQAGKPAQLWLELGREDEDDVRLLSIDLTTADLEQMLDRSTGDDVLVALDGYALNGLFDDREVEAHGLRTSLAIAIVAGAIAAPSAMAASNPAAASNPLASKPAASHVQAVNPATSRVQAVNPASVRTQAVSPASKAQAVNPASKAQSVKPASKTQSVKPASKAQSVKPASKALSVKPAAKAQLSKSLIVKASGLRLLGGKTTLQQ